MVILMVTMMVMITLIIKVIPRWGWGRSRGRYVSRQLSSWLLVIQVIASQYWLYRCLHHTVRCTCDRIMTSGILGLVLQYITPLTIAPSVAMIGLRWIKTVLQRLVLFHFYVILDSFYAFFLAAAKTPIVSFECNLGFILCIFQPLRHCCHERCPALGSFNGVSKAS